MGRGNQYESLDDNSSKQKSGKQRTSAKAPKPDKKGGEYLSHLFRCTSNLKAPLLPPKSERYATTPKQGS